MYKRQTWAQPDAPEATITVVNGQVAVNANGQCSLIEAIQNADSKTNGHPNNDCATGNPNGADTINLPANGLFTLNNVHHFDDIGDIGLPWISTTVTINGNGSTIQRNSTAPKFRIMAVGNNGNLTLNNATISGGYISTGDSYSESLGRAYGGGGQGGGGAGRRRVLRPEDGGQVGVGVGLVGGNARQTAEDEGGGAQAEKRGEGKHFSHSLSLFKVKRCADGNCAAITSPDGPRQAIIP